MPGTALSTGLCALVALAGALGGCASPEPAPAAPGRVPRDGERGGLFHDFVDGKLDGLGHPIGAVVWQAEEACASFGGRVRAEGWGASPEQDAAGQLCAASAEALGAGRHVLNLRLLLDEEPAGCAAGEGCAGAGAGAGSASVGDAADEALVVVVRDAAGQELARETITRARLGPPGLYANVAVRFVRQAPGTVRFELDWPGRVPVRLDYVELFREGRRIVVAPTSGVPEPGAVLEVETSDPPDGAELELRCAELDRTPRLRELLASGEAALERTDFRQVLRAPLAAILDGCSLPARLTVSLVAGGWTRATSRTTYYAEEPACTFEPGTTRVLLTGFEPFPADSRYDNSSEQAVLAFEPASVPGVSVTRLVLPVEWDTAPGMLARALERCRPDVVIGFGQGRWAVDVETAAYNRKDTSEVAGGVPDNRGLVFGGEPIVPGGAAELGTRLPAAAIVAALGQAGIDAATSDDPGRYLCNELFYGLMSEVAAAPVIAGFVHLPRIPRVDDAERARLGGIVTTVVAHAVAAAATTGSGSPTEP